MHADAEKTFHVPAHPGASTPQLSARMSQLARRDTAPEVAVRRQLHAGGLRYRVAYPVPGRPRRSIDIAFTGSRLAVFIDGCFWHGCPIHGTAPSANSVWWSTKFAANTARDADTTEHLISIGWRVMRFWEHENPLSVCAAVRACVRPPRLDIPSSDSPQETPT